MFSKCFDEKTKKNSPCPELRNKNDSKTVSENPEKCGPEKNKKKYEKIICFFTLSHLVTAVLTVAAVVLADVVVVAAAVDDLNYVLLPLIAIQKSHLSEDPLEQHRIQ